MKEHWFYLLTDNRTVAIIIGAIVGLLIWFWQHKIENRNKYFSEYLDYVFRFFSIKQEEADLRKGKNKICWKILKNKKDIDIDEKLLRINDRLSQLNKKQIQISGKIRARLFLLKQLKDNRIYEIEKMRSEFEDDFNKFSKITVVDESLDKMTKPDVYECEVKCINQLLDKARNKVEEIIENEK